jgi:hypothetical protein
VSCCSTHKKIKTPFLIEESSKSLMITEASDTL